MFEKTAERVLSRLSEVSIDSGDATDGSLTTIVDTIKNWEVNKWINAIVEVEVDDVHYYRTVTSNTATTLTITALPAGHPVAAGDHYNIRLSTRIVQISGQAIKISGQVVQISGQAVKISGQTVVVQSGSYVMADISGETVSIETPTMLKTGPVRTLASASGGVVLHSGSVKAAVVKALTDNSGVVLVGGSGDRPWYESVGSAQGIVMAAGEAQSKDISNFDAIYVVAQISGDKVSFDGVN